MPLILVADNNNNNQNNSHISIAPKVVTSEVLAAGHVTVVHKAEKECIQL